MSGDFFSSAPSSTVPDTHDDFAHAISLRFGSADLRTARLLPGDHPAPRRDRSLQSPSPRPSRAPSIAPLQQPFAHLLPSALPPFLDDPASLVLDIRPHAAFAAARIHNALSLSVPTTLLKRPLFSLSRLSQMLPSPSSRARFASWSSASRILVYDSDSTSSPDNGIIAGLLRKFRAEGFVGELAWVRGGFQAVWREARHLATTDVPPPEEDDPDPASSLGTLRTSHLPKAAFSLFSTTAAPPHQLGPIPPSHPLPNTPASSASYAANPFYDTIRQNVELSHGITERIPLRLPRRIRRRIHDLPFPWLQDIARRSALRHPSAFRHSGLDSLESGSESSDDLRASDPDDNDPNVEEGAEALAMQFYRIELAEQRRLRSIMEHHTRESELARLSYPSKPRRALDKPSLGIATTKGGVTVRIGAKSVPGTPYPSLFPFSITAGVEKGTKNRYTHIWPFEHARVRLHDGRHQGSYPSKRDKSKASDRGRSTKDWVGEKGKEKEEHQLWQDRHRRSRSSPAFGKTEGPEVAELVGASLKHPFYSDAWSSVAETTAGSASKLAACSTLSPGPPSIPQVRIEYDITEQDSRLFGTPTPATALPLSTPPFYTPMDISPVPTPMHARSPQLVSLPSGINVSPGARSGGTQLTLPSLGPLPSFPLRLPNRPGGLLPSIGEQTRMSESPPSPRVPVSGILNKEGAIGEAELDAGTKRDLRREPSPADDYVNASYVQPLGTRKRYIATQGPLPSTYVDFWTLVWEQNVHVIVMLTREIEGAMVKCGAYWTDTEYGPLRLELLSISPPMSANDNATSTDISKQGFFAIREPRGRISSNSRDQPSLITRTFALSHVSYPRVPPRRITHLQYLDWSDMNVPDDPQGVLHLIKRLEQAIAESIPGPSPSEGSSAGSPSGSPSGSLSPEVGSDRKGYDLSLLSPTSAGFVPGGAGRRRNEWRHPELDSKTGIAAFALGKASPVLLHCSAGVGRTGGFIAVDAVLDGIKRELRKKREKRCSESVPGVGIVNTEGGGDKTSGELSLESTEAGVNSVESSGKESASGRSERMDVDEPNVDKAEAPRDLLYRINTVPIHVSAGDHTKSRRRRYQSKDPSGEEFCSSSESLVVHVPCVGSDDVPDETNVTGIDLGNPKETGRQSSTREWVEQVSDQAHTHAGEEDHPSPPLPPVSSRERSPGCTSSSSGPSALNSVDDSMNGSADANASGSAGGSQGGNKVERKSNMSGSGTGSRSGSGCPPPSVVSKQGTGSTSLSNSGSGTGTGSRLGSSLLRVRLRDSSVTSISAESIDSFSPGYHEPKLSAVLHQPLVTVIHTSSSSDMEIDHPPRFVSVPLSITHSNAVVHQRLAHSKAVLGASPVASISSPILSSRHAERDYSFSSGATEGSLSHSSDRGSDVSPPSGEFKSGENAEAAGIRKNSRVLSNDSGKLGPSKVKNNLRLNIKLSSLEIPDTLRSSSPTGNPSKENEDGKRTPILLDPHILDGPILSASGIAGAIEHHQGNVDHPVIDYKLPRELHGELSPPLISSFAEPICTVIQDMREQRMSLCQSLRQYVFVHAAIIEGALRIVDEERELWGCLWTNDDSSSAEEELGANFRDSGRQSRYKEGPEAQVGWEDGAEVAVRTPEPDHPRTRPLHIVSQPSSHRNVEAQIRGSQAPLDPTSSASSISSPSKGKRGPSPTELLREDKTGALSLNKRPSIHRQTTQEDDQALFELNRPSLVTGESGTPGDMTAVGMYGARTTTGQAGAPEKGGPTGGDRAVFE